METIHPVKETIKLETGTFIFHANFLRFIIDEEANMNLRNMTLTGNVVKDTLQKNKVPVLVDASKRFNITSSVMRLLTSKRTNSNALAIAFLVKDFSSRLKVHNLINNYSTSLPLKYFLNEYEAITWLNNYKLNNYSFDKI